MRINGFHRAWVAAAAVMFVVAGCASSPRPIGAPSTPSSMTTPLRGAPSTPARQTFSFGSMLRDMGHAVVRGVSWLFRVPSGVYGPPEKVAYSNARTWKEATGTTGCTIRCDRVQRNSVNPIH
jgi:hypothetical protein